MGRVKDVSKSETHRQTDRPSDRPAMHEEVWFSYLSLIRLAWALGSPGLLPVEDMFTALWDKHKAIQSEDTLKSSHKNTLRIRIYSMWELLTNDESIVKYFFFLIR